MSNEAPDPAMLQAAVKQRLYEAITKNDAAVLKAALDAGLNIADIRGPGGFNVLHVAAAEKAPDVVKLLLSIGMNPLEEGNDGVTALDVAKHQRHDEIVGLMEDAIRTRNAPTTPTILNDPETTEAFWNVIVQGVATNDTKDIQAALNAGFSREILAWRGPQGVTLLHLAAFAGSLDIANLLLSAGCDPRVATTDGLTPTDAAKAKGHGKVADLLSQAAKAADKGSTSVRPSSPSSPAPVSAETVETATQLIVQAVIDNDLANVRQALDKGLNIENIRGPNGETLLHLAGEHGQTDMVKLLLDAGVDPLVEMTNGISATELAYVNKHFETGDVLQEAVKAIGARAQEAYREAIAREATKDGHPDASVTPQAPTSDPAPPSSASRTLSTKEKHLYGTAEDDLAPFWKPGQSRAMARMRKSWADAKQRVADEQAAKDAAAGKAPAEQPAPAATVAPVATSNAPAAQPTPTFPPLTPTQERFKAAILNGDAESLREQVESGFPVNDPVFAGSAALHLAAADGKAHVVRALLALGADLNDPDQQGNTALLYALGHQRTEVAILLAQQPGIDVNHRAPSGHTALHAAVKANVPLAVPYLLAKGADTTAVNQAGQTPLQFAEALKRDDIAVALRYAPVPMKAEPTTEPAVPVQATSAPEPNEVNDEPDGSDGHTQEALDAAGALIEAIRTKDLAKVKALATKDTSFLRDRNGIGPLHVACAIGDPDVVRHLLDCGLDPELPAMVKGEEVTPIDVSIQQGSDEIYELLRRAQDGKQWLVMRQYVSDGNLDDVKGLDNDLGVLQYADDDGWTLLHEAATAGHLPIVHYLVNRGVDVHAVVKDQETEITALEIAEQREHHAIADVLRREMQEESLNADADNFRDALNRFHLRRVKRVAEACEAGDLETVRTVVTGSYDPILELTDEDGASLLHFAVSGGDPAIVRFLVEHGIDLQSRVKQTTPGGGTEGPYTPLDLARVLEQTEAIAVLEEACDAAHHGRGIDGETPNVKAIRKPDGGLYVGVYNRYTGDRVHRTMADRLRRQVLEENGEPFTESSTEREAPSKEMESVFADMLKAFRK